MQRALPFVIATLLLAGCEEKKPAPQPTPSASATALASSPPPASASAPAPSASAAAADAGKAEDPEKEKVARHCPSSVTGATTALKDVDGGIELTVVAKDATATADVRTRAKALLEASKAPSDSTRHTGKGGGHGTFGRCPVVLRDTVLTLADVEGGTKITVKAKDKAEVVWLRQQTRERAAELNAPGAEGAGAGKMVHCPSTVDGASTKVEATKDAVLVTVTGNADAATQIRKRAQHLVEAAKKDPASIKHSGEGSGGGGLGRCPVVLKDTTVTAKDVEGGSQITVKPLKPEGLAALQKEAKDRAAGLAAPHSK